MFKLDNMQACYSLDEEQMLKGTHDREKVFLDRLAKCRAEHPEAFRALSEQIRTCRSPKAVPRVTRLEWEQALG